MPYHHLTLAEREVISQLRYSGASLSQIAGRLWRSPGTISREIERNTMPGWDRYWAHLAQWVSDLRRSSSKRPFAQHAVRVWSYVGAKLKEGWSPEQIAGRIKREYPEDESMRISHETIYAWIAEDRRDGGDLWKHLRQSHRKRRKRYGSPERRGRINGRVGIEKRPKVVATRRRLGDWESDTMEGRRKRGYLVTHVERKSRYVVAARINDKRAESVNRGTWRAFRWIPPDLRKTLTVDNGKEFSGFQQIERELGFSVYFADAYASWQRGTCENTNGLLRHFFPKGTDFQSINHNTLAAAVRKLNNRPRKCLGYRTPHEVLFDDD